MKKLSHKLLLVAALFVAATADVAAQNNDPATNKRIVEERNFVFVAQQASTNRGRVIQLTGGYDLTVSGDSVIAYLPFFGRAFTAPYNSTDGGIKFTSTSFKYDVTTKKKRWEIAIRPSDVSDTQQMFLDVSENGYATLRITNVNRTPMSYTGYIMEGKEKSKKAF